MDEVSKRQGLLHSCSLKVIRTFRPEPNVLTCRWEVSFNRTDRQAMIKGISKYLLKVGRVYSLEEMWQTEQQVPSSNLPWSLPWNQVFVDSLDFQSCRRPVGLLKYGRDGFVPAYKYAAWEALKDDKKLLSVGGTGQLTRQDLDSFIMQSLYSWLIIFGSAFLLAPRLLYKNSVFLSGLIQAFFKANN